MSTAAARPSASPQTATDPLQLIDVDHVQFYVGNAKQAAAHQAKCQDAQQHGGEHAVAHRDAAPHGRCCVYCRCVYCH